MTNTRNYSKIEKFAWKDISLSVPSHDENKVKYILNDVSGEIRPGEVMALMGPSGSGKTSLLNILAHRSNPKSSVKRGDVLINNSPVTMGIIKEVSSYVEQEDSLIGSLTVAETLDFSAQFSGNSKQNRRHLVEETLANLGLTDQRNLKIGTPLQKGISGGQKRRVSIGCQIITRPSILFLDEPTSGLDSVASKEVISMIKRVAVEENIVVICSIHQPSTSTFNVFDKVLFLSKGQTVYNGDVKAVASYFESIGQPIPSYFNPAEYVLDLINTEFAGNSSRHMDEASELSNRDSLLEILFLKWQEQEALTNSDNSALLEKYALLARDNEKKVFCPPCVLLMQILSQELSKTRILLQRSLIKARRDVLAYYVRIVMYIALSIMMGTVWLRLGSKQENIQPFINAIFFSGAFMSFMSVAYIPAFIEDYHSYNKENKNGLYGPFSFMLSNFVIGLPFLFIISLLFSIVTYFMCNFRHSSEGFGYYVMWLFLDLVAAESMTVFIASVFSNYVVALALTAFANGLWMCVGGFLVSQRVLNSFWYYTFYWIDYQRYVFQGMMFNEFLGRAYDCDSTCHCMYESALSDQCKIAGEAVLSNLGYTSYDKGLWIGVLIALIFAFRFLSYAALKIKG